MNKPKPVVDILPSVENPIHITDGFGRWFSGVCDPDDEKCPKCGEITVIEFRRVRGEGAIVEECPHCDYFHMVPDSLRNLKVRKAG